MKQRSKMVSISLSQNDQNLLKTFLKDETRRIMATLKMSIDIDKNEYKYLKMCCKKLDVTVNDFVNKAIIEQVESWEDKWMLEKWKREGTHKEITDELYWFEDGKVTPFTQEDLEQWKKKIGKEE
jgi:hypothetical protein